MSKVVKTIGKTREEKLARRVANHRFLVEWEKTWANEYHRHYFIAYWSGRLGRLFGGGAVTIREMVGDDG